MVHVAETGAGLPDANAYLEAAAATAYWADHGAPAAWITASQPSQELSIRTATQYLDAIYGGRWRGCKKLSTQTLAWPRAGAADDDGYWIRSDTVPAQLVAACAELALKVLGGESLMPDIAKPGALASESKTVGPITISKAYLGGQSQVKRYSLVDRLLAPLLVSGSEVIRS